LVLVFGFCFLHFSVINALSALVIIAEHSFLLWDKSHSYKSFAAAVECYRKSSQFPAVKQCVMKAFEEHQNAFASEEAKNALGQQLLKISLDHRLHTLPVQGA
jgi:maltodextrin utilization protein YvdJ